MRFRHAATLALVVSGDVTQAQVAPARDPTLIKHDNITPFIPPNPGAFGHFGWSGVLRGAGVMFFAYAGFDSVSTAASARCSASSAQCS